MKHIENIQKELNEMKKQPLLAEQWELIRKLQYFIDKYRKGNTKEEK